MKNNALNIVLKLRKLGFEAYWAGGCVRDILLNKEPHDFDVVTSATPSQIQNILKNTSSVGKSFGVILVKIDNQNFEIATFRSEGKYSDSRRPDKVFWSNAKEDAKRRDFTINGMFYDPVNKQVIDYVNGLDDLKNRTIRFIGNPNDRIKEDYLRILRAVRFKNAYDFKYDKRSFEAIMQNAYRIEKVSKERVAQELNKIFSHKNRAKALDDLSQLNILKYILPEIERMKGVRQPDQFHKEGDVYIHTLEALKSLPEKSPLALVWAVLLHDSGKPDTISYPQTASDRIRFNKHVKFSAGIASKVTRRYKFSNTERQMIVYLVKNHMEIASILKMNKLNKRKMMLDPRFPWLLKLFKADIMGTKPRRFDLYNKNVILYEKIKSEYEKEQNKPNFKLLLTGNDLMTQFNLKSGPKIGKILKKVEEAQLEDKIKTKNQAVKYIKNNFTNYIK